MSVKHPEKIPGIDRAVFTVDEARQILGLQKSTAYLAIARGHIPSIRIGRQIRVPRDAIERMLNPE